MRGQRNITFCHPEISVHRGGAAVVQLSFEIFLHPKANMKSVIKLQAAMQASVALPTLTFKLYTNTQVLSSAAC